MDSILLQDIRVRTHIGVPEDERKTEQTILVSVELFVPMKKTAKSDDIRDAIDYAAVTEEVVGLRKTERKTVERLAEDIAAMLLVKFKPEGGVKVTVTKTPPLPLRSASITIIRP